MLIIIFNYPINCLLTLPRVTFEAAKLAYVKKLPVYQRPDAYLTYGSGKTITRKEPSKFQALSKQIVLDYLESLRLKNLNVDYLEIESSTLWLFIVNEESFKAKIFLVCSDLAVMY